MAGTNSPIGVLLVDDQSLLREGLRTLLELHPDIKVLGEAGDGNEAARLVESLAPNVVLMDIRMPRCDGIEATRKIAQRRPEIQIIVLTTYDDDQLIFESLDAGACGYLLKDVGSDGLAEAVRAANRGESPLQPSVARKLLKRLRTSVGPAPKARPESPGVEELTPRETEILGLLGQGATNREIADTLSLTEGTVKNYISSILAKTNLRDRTQAALFAVRAGFVTT
jgi:DNA-binding NarL/FixJ family response regulator